MCSLFEPRAFLTCLRICGSEIYYYYFFFNLFEYLVVLHVLLGSFIGVFGLVLQICAGVCSRCQLTDQSDHSPHHPETQTQHKTSPARLLTPAVGFSSSHLLIVVLYSIITIYGFYHSI